MIATEVSATGIIGPQGGRLELPRAGLWVDFAPGAVTTPTRITVTASRGRNVAYRFEPHGLVFVAPVTLRQRLDNTVAWKNPHLAARLEGSYFSRLLVDRTHSFARSDERREAKLSDDGRLLEFSIEHFSGYMVSTGKAPVEIDVDIDIEIGIR